MSTSLLMNADLAVQIHLAAVALGFAGVGAVMFLRRGTPAHRFAGRLFGIGMIGAAISSFWITELNDGQFSFVHIISVVTIVSVILGIRAVRRGNVRAHGIYMISTAVGGLGVAGALAMIDRHRLMYQLLFGA